MNTTIEGGVIPRTATKFGLFLLTNGLVGQVSSDTARLYATLALQMMRSPLTYKLYKTLWARPDGGGSSFQLVCNGPIINAADACPHFMLLCLHSPNNKGRKPLSRKFQNCFSHMASDTFADISRISKSFNLQMDADFRHVGCKNGGGQIVLFHGSPE